MCFFIRTRPCFFCILFHIVSTSEFVTLAGAMPVDLCTDALKPATKSGSTSMYLYLFLYVKNLWSLLRMVRCARSTTEHLISGFLRTWNWIPSRFNRFWKVILKNSFPLSVRTQTGRPFMVSNISGLVKLSEMLNWHPYQFWILVGLYARIFKRRLWLLGDICTRRYICWGLGRLPGQTQKHLKHYWRYKDFSGIVCVSVCVIYKHLASVATFWYRLPI